NLGISMPDWLPWSTDPAASSASLRALLPAFALLVVGVQLNDVARRRLLWAVLLVALLSVPLGLAQIVQGSDSPLRLYRPTNHHEAVGLFANRNHYAALLYVGLSLAVGAFLVFDRRLVGRGPTRVAHALGWLVLLTILLLGLMLTRSRAGVGLALLAMVLSVGIGMQVQRRIRLSGLMLAGTAIVLAAAWFGFDAISQRLEADWLADNRWRVSAAAWALAADYGWLGSGAGSFPAAYAAFEPIDLVGDKIINHAHNDWFEWLVELGLPVALLLLALLAWMWSRARALAQLDWQRASPLILSSALALLLLALHSVVDYPLRTSAMMLAAMALLLQLLQDHQSKAVPEGNEDRAALPLDASDSTADPTDQPRLRLVHGSNGHSRAHRRRR
ncbi:MAG: O-antigen ligase family protein, partial [Xanthomonadales bacterium]|nr:O-antigen ligase family protein [Xanthomonadales bacterium]